MIFPFFKYLVQKLIFLNVTKISSWFLVILLNSIEINPNSTYPLSEPPVWVCIGSQNPMTIGKTPDQERGRYNILVKFLPSGFRYFGALVSALGPYYVYFSAPFDTNKFENIKCNWFCKCLIKFIFIGQSGVNCGGTIKCPFKRFRHKMSVKRFWHKVMSRRDIIRPSDLVRLFRTRNFGPKKSKYTKCKLHNSDRVAGSVEEQLLY